MQPAMPSRVATARQAGGVKLAAAEDTDQALDTTHQAASAELVEHARTALKA
jgi:hypothetical protein